MNIILILNRFITEWLLLNILGGLHCYPPSREIIPLLPPNPHLLRNGRLLEAFAVEEAPFLVLGGDRLQSPLPILALKDNRLKVKLKAWVTLHSGVMARQL